MRNVLLVIKREYLVRVRSKAFLIFTVLMPMLLGAAMILPAKLSMQSSGTKHIVIVTADAALADSVRQELVNGEKSIRGEDSDEDTTEPTANASAKKTTKKEAGPDFDVRIETTPTDELRRDLTEQVRTEKLDGFAWLDSSVVQTRRASYVSRNSTDFLVNEAVRRAIRLGLTQQQLATRGIAKADADQMLKPVKLDTVRVDRSGKEKKSGGLGAFMLPMILMMTVYATTLIYGLSVMRSVIEEKSSRVIEVLLSSLTPMQLMAGKIIGVGAVGATQVFIWATAGVLFGTGGMAALGEVLKGGQVSTALIVMFPVFFLLGYGIYSCLYAAVGSMVNSEEEAQQLQLPITLPLIACAVLASGIIRDPNSSLAFWLSMFPLTSPIIMFVRAAVAMPPVWQIALSIGLDIGCMFLLVWICSRIYRVGILMYGKRPTLPEIVKWIRYA